MLLLNAFSLNMLVNFPATVSFNEVSLDEARKLLAGGFTSAVGHPDTAAVFSSMLELHVSAQRCTVQLDKGENALIGQYRGPRLKEGATTLPTDATIQWVVVSL